MIFKELLTDKLNKKRAEFTQFALAQNADLADYLLKLNILAEIPLDELERKFGREDNIGAWPSAELTASDGLAVSFAETWRNHEEARRWAFEVLQNRTTFAADGSQLFVEREVSLPVAAVQIGWFENPHNETLSYEKNAHFEVLSPEELLAEQEEPVIPETRVGQKRFELEVEKVSDFLHRKQGWQARGERLPLAFFDGTLLISFARPNTSLQESFVRTMVNLVKLSQAMEVPLVGYVDRSYARDLLTLLDTVDGTQNDRKRTLDDASVLHTAVLESKQILKKWGDRTIFCYSRRRGLSDFTSAETGRPLVGFSYLQTTAESPPARLDIPAWIYEAGMLDDVIDTVRAECVIGLGYPYALETADQTAVITLRDREIFLQALQVFAKENNLALRVSRKAASKGRRR